MPFPDIDWNRGFAEAHARGELLKADTFMPRMGWTRAQLDCAVSKGRVFLLMRDGPAYVPSFFCTDHFPRRHVRLVSAALGTISPGGKWQFFMTGKGSLGGVSPLVALARGHLRAVRHTAIAHAER